MFVQHFFFLRSSDLRLLNVKFDFALSREIIYDARKEPDDGSIELLSI